jgi:hypothetical protein
MQATTTGKNVFKEEEKAIAKNKYAVEANEICDSGWCAEHAW